MRVHMYMYVAYRGLKYLPNLSALLALERVVVCCGRSEVIALLQEVSGSRLPLCKFIELYEKRYHRTISVSELYRMRGVVEVQEMEGSGRSVTLVSSPRIRYSSLTLIVRW